MVRDFEPSWSDPAAALVGLGALCAIMAAGFWVKVARGVDASGDVVRGPAARDLGSAAFLTAGALAFAGAGYLFGRFTGRF